MSTRPPEQPCWIVWAVTKKGHVIIRAICTTEALADDYAAWAKKETFVAGAIVEESRLNHLYCGAIGGEPAIERRERSKPTPVTGESAAGEGRL